MDNEIDSTDDSTDDSNDSTESKPNIEEPEFTKQTLFSSRETKSYLSPQENTVLSYNEIILANDEEESDIANKNLDLDEKLERMIERSQGIWKCKVCDKTSNYKKDIIRHTETHLKGIKHSCNICMKNFPTRHGLNVHTSDLHTQLYFCQICGRTDMNKKTLRQTHKRHCNGTPLAQ